MSSPLLDELHWVTEALRAHVDWSRSTGALGLPPCDADWLEQRREHYRKTELRDPDINQWGTPANVQNVYSPSGPTPQAAAPQPQIASPAPAPAPTRTQTNARPTTPQRPSVSEREATTRADTSVQSVIANLGNPIQDGDATPQGEPRVPAPAVSRVATKPAERTSLNPEQKRARLVTLQQEVQACTSCGLCTERKNPAFARGTGSAKIAFVGEGPGAEEDAQGVPFVGAAGQLLDRMIAAMGLSRDDVYVCNIIKCRPPNNRKPTDDEIAACRHFVVEQLHLLEPQVIVALGGTAVEGLLGVKLGITRLRGTWRLYAGRIPVMPTFHPAYLLRKPEAKREVWEDLQAVLTRINRSVPPRG